MPKLTQAQQRVIDAMAGGETLVCDKPWGESGYKNAVWWVASAPVLAAVRIDCEALLNAGCFECIKGVSNPEGFYVSEYKLTELGLSLARKDGENDQQNL